MASRNDDHDPNRRAFRDAIGNVQRLKQDRVAPFRARRKPIAEQAQRDAEEVMQSLLSGAYDHSLVETGEELLYVRPGLRPSAARKLRRGQYAIEAELDLHGQRVPEAHALINDFLRTARLEGKRCLKIIHGKGLSSDAKLPVLKGKVDSWLRRKGEVLAYCSARPDDGGTGAVYVLLKRK